MLKMIKEEIISVGCFEFLYSLIGKDYSRENILQAINSVIYEYADCSSLKETEEQEGLNLRKARKIAQYNGVLKIIEELGEHRRILEIGSGNGRLVRKIAERFRNAQITGLEKDIGLVKKLRGSDIPPNVHFEEGDAFSFFPEKKPDLVISLHGCGNLTDRVLDIAINSKANVICVPCCYPKIKRKTKGQVELPRSNSLASFKETYKKVILRRAAKLDGAVDDIRETRPNVMRSLYRLLVDFDRALYLKEKGYEVTFVNVYGRYFKSGSEEKANSPLRRALVGKIKN